MEIICMFFYRDSLSCSTLLMYDSSQKTFSHYWGVTYSHHSSFSSSNRTTKNSETQNKLGIASSTIYHRFKVKI